MFLTLFLFSLTVAQSKFGNDVQPGNILYDVNGRIRGFSDVNDKDIILGAIIPVHNSSQGVCSDALYLETVEYVESFLYSLDLINTDDTLLPNITIGYDIRDSCLSENVAVVETMDLVLESNSPMEFQSEQCTTFENITSRVVSGIVGAQVSFVTIPIASLLSLVHVPQVSYLSTSPLLNNRERYPYFYRTVPSDDQQAQVMRDVALHFGWLYVSTIYSDDLYGEPGIERFRELAEKSGICIDLDEGISSTFTDEQYAELVNKLLFNSTANVVVLFSSLNQAKDLFERMQMMRVYEIRHFLWITSDAVTLSPVIFPKYAKILSGSLGVIPLSDNDPGFVKYYSSLTPLTNKRNPWFIQYYEHFYNCSAGQTMNCMNINSSITDHPDYASNQNAPLIIDAAYTFAHAIKSYIHDNCEVPVVWNSTTSSCNGAGTEFSGQSLETYLRNVNFTSPTGNHIEFTRTGSVDGKYRIFNYQHEHESQYDFIDIGIWNELQHHRLELNKSILLQFGVDESGNISYSVKSRCRQCPSGYFKATVQYTCCGECFPCLGQNYTQENLTECSKCPDDMWGNEPLSGSSSCVNIEKVYPDPAYSLGVLSIVLSLVTLISTIVATILTALLWNASNWNLSRLGQFIILAIGAVSSSVSTSFFVSEPSVGICTLQRISEWISTSLLLSPLLTIEALIAWNFLVKGHIKREFVKFPYQMVLTILLIIIQLSLTLMSLLVIYPAVNRNLVDNAENINDYPTLFLNCVPSHIGTDIPQIVFHSALLFLLCSLAVLTFKVKENFNESKCITISALSLIIIWISFLITYFSLAEETRSIVIPITLQLNAQAVLFFFLLPSLFLVFRGTVSNPTTPSGNRGSLTFSIRSINRVSIAAKKITSDTQM